MKRQLKGKLDKMKENKKFLNFHLVSLLKKLINAGKLKKILLNFRSIFFCNLFAIGKMIGKVSSLFFQNNSI